MIILINFQFSPDVWLAMIILINFQFSPDVWLAMIILINFQFSPDVWFSWIISIRFLLFSSREVPHEYVDCHLLGQQIKQNKSFTIHNS